MKQTLWWAWTLGFIVSLNLISVPIDSSLQAPTPTAATLNPPPGGGVVAVELLAVRAGASTDWPRIGGLEYGTEVFPTGRNTETSWVIIDWNNGNLDGYIFAASIEWHPDFDLESLPVVSPPPTETPIESATNQSSLTPTNTPTNQASSTPEAAIPSATSTETVLPTASPSPIGTISPTPISAVQPVVTSVPPPIISAEPVTNPIPGDLPVWLPFAIGGGTLFLILLISYLQRRNKSALESARYASGFPLPICPVCQEGQYELEEHITKTFGLVTVKRSARCTNCLSVLRQIEPGVWRYTLDANANPALVSVFELNMTLTDVHLRDFAVEAASYPPQAKHDTDSLAPSEAFVSAIEQLAELEATVIAAQEAEEAEALVENDEENPIDDETDQLEDETDE